MTPGSVVTLTPGRVLLVKSTPPPVAWDGVQHGPRGPATLRSEA
jgi:hypothetical protein